MTFRCNNCMTVFEDDDELDLINMDGEWVKVCPNCQTDEYLMDLDDDEELAESALYEKLRAVVKTRNNKFWEELGNATQEEPAEDEEKEEIEESLTARLNRKLNLSLKEDAGKIHTFDLAIALDKNPEKNDVCKYLIQDLTEVANPTNVRQDVAPYIGEGFPSDRDLAMFVKTHFLPDWQGDYEFNLDDLSVKVIDVDYNEAKGEGTFKVSVAEY